MEKKPIDPELAPTEKAKALWDNFEKTGSVTDYLEYVEKMENRQEVASVLRPS